MAEISRVAYDDLVRRKAELETRIEEDSKQVKEARDLGDFSENTELETARTQQAQNRAELEEVEMLLRTATIKEVYSNRIGIGSLITVKILGDDGEVVDDLGLLMFDELGDLLFKGRILGDSTLGRAIQGTEGSSTEPYTIQRHDGSTYKVLVVLEPESRMPDFLAKYPPERQDAMLSGTWQDE